MRRRIAVALVVSGLVVACSTQVDRVAVGPTAATPETAASGPADGVPADTAATTTPSTLAPAPMAKEITDAPSVQVVGTRAEQAYDGFVAQVVIDLDSFWASAYPAISGGAAYDPLERGIWPVWPDAQGVPGCGGETRTSYPEIEDNAFYCPDEDFIAFDDEYLFPRLEDDFGRYTVAMVLAHEWGHAIQARLGSSLPGVITELQADCFAGSWMDRVRDGGAAGLQLTDPDLRLAIIGILEFRDSPGTSADDEGAHGSAFDRLGSFQDGLEGGAPACEAYAASPPVVLELPFNSLDDQQTQGDMPLETLVDSVPADLDRFWGALLERSGTPFEGLSGTVQTYAGGGPYPGCSSLTPEDFEQGVVYCPSPEFVAYEQGGSNARLHNTIGDFSVGVLFADRWAEAVQHHLGLSTEGAPAALQRDCLTGVWVEDVVPRPTREQAFAISPGDLDEAVRTYLLFTEDAEESAEAALARIGSFRSGVFTGLESCGL
jgi:predicted metalloprotease